ncbi:hypothetical protein NCS52_00849800 [Fusarium sp. LHS14.1]|nr:hypothetical protein NCS52_00849800 [Fusarium sp. LHS14.1]
MVRRSGRISSRQLSNAASQAPPPRTPAPRVRSIVEESADDLSINPVDARSPHGLPLPTPASERTTVGSTGVQGQRRSGRREAQANVASLLATPVSARKTTGPVHVTDEGNGEEMDLEAGSDGEDGDDDDDDEVDECIHIDSEYEKEEEADDDDIDEDEIDGYLDIDYEDEVPIAIEGEDGGEEEEEEEEEERGDFSVGEQPRKRAHPSAGEQSRKKARPSTNETAEQWISTYNRVHPIHKDDSDLQRFQSRMRALIERICSWARSGEDIAAWFRLEQSKLHMTRGFRSTLLRVDHDELATRVLGHMPDKTQQVLGKRNLEPFHMLDLPEVPEGFLHRLTYVDVPVRVGYSNVGQQQSRFRRVQVKALKPGADFQETMEAKVYVGSSINRLGGWIRVREHEKESNKEVPISSMHYRFSGQRDVVPNFRLIGAWSNPHVLDDQDAGNDLERWLPVFLEGILMVFLGTYHLQNRGTSELALKLSPLCSYRLVDDLRQNLGLPDFHNHSLNQVWPLCQGVYGGMTVVSKCANPECQRPKAKANGFHTISSTFSGRICSVCYKHAKKNNGLLRTREGLANGQFKEENNLKAINQAWFAMGNPRKCSNKACRVDIPENANIYGATTHIRCMRCHECTEKVKREWGPGANSGPVHLDDPAKCTRCPKLVSDVHIWGQERLCEV